MENHRYLLVFLMAGLLVFTGNCKKDTNPQPEVNKVDSVNVNLPTDPGSIGLTLNTRPIAKEGYHPDHLEVKMEGAYSKFNRSMQIDGSTFISVLKYPVDSLTEDEVKGFKNGADLEIKIYDDSEKVLGDTTLTGQIIDESDISIDITTDLPPIFPAVSLSQHMSFIIQAEEDGKVLQIPQYNVLPSGSITVGTDDYAMENNQDQRFYFKHVQGEADSVYCITSYRGYLMDFDFLNQFVESTAKWDAGNVPDKLKVIVSPDKDGWVKIRYKTGGYLQWQQPDFGYVVIRKSDNSFSRFRLLNGDIVWNMTDMGTYYEQPVLPPAQLEFAYKATLKNCSSATLTESVGRSETRTQTSTYGTEESLALFSSSEYSTEIKAGVDVDATFFGKGATYSLEATAGYTYTTSSTETNTNYWEASTSKEVEISRERTVEIGPETAIEVYDAVQTLDKVRLPFTKNFRLKGKDSDENALTGEEISFLLYSNQFGGVIAEIGSDYVDFTLKGTTLIDQMMEVETRTDEIKGGCSGGN